jgi:uncharacterized SAM-binding protein YcdF (DUF218 family)
VLKYKGFFSKPLGKVTVFLSVLLVIFLLLLFSLPSLGNFLVVEDTPQSVDAIIVLMGSGPDRMMGAVDIYKLGYSDKIIMVRNMVSGYDLAAELGVVIPHAVDIAKDVAVQLGVPDECIEILPGDALSTGDEAVIVREHLKKKSHANSLMIVTSKYHSRRSKVLFVKAMKSLDREIKIISYPTKYDNFNATQWWKNREDMKLGVLEYFKLLNFYVREQFGM